MHETVAVIVNSRLVLFIHLHQHLKDGLGILSLVHRECWRELMKAASMAPTPRFETETLVLAGKWLIWRRKDSVRLRICLLIIRYIRRRAQEAHQIHLLGKEYVLCFCLMTHEFLIWHDPALIYPGILKEAFQNIDFNEFGHCYKKGRSSNVQIATLITTYGLARNVSTAFSLQFWEQNSRMPSRLIDWRLFGSPTLPCVRAWLCLTFCVAEESHNCVLDFSRNGCDLLAYRIV